MKQIIKQLTWLLPLLFTFAACSPKELDDYSLEGIHLLTDEQVSFTLQVSPENDNVITFTNTSDLEGVYTLDWDLGNGSSAKANSVTAQYPFAGEYTVQLTIYTPAGSRAARSVVVSIAADDYTLVDTPAYRNLTGGAENSEGKTWVLDQYNNYAREVAQATGFDITGHIGLGPLGSRGQEWWGAAPNDKQTWQIYSSKFTFIQNGVRLIIEKEGDEGYGRKASSASVGGFNVHKEEGDDAFFTFSGGEYNFSIDESGEYPLLTLSGNGFLGYYCGSQDYELIYQTEQVMALRVANLVESQDWVFVYCLEELNISGPPVVVEAKAIPLEEDFEGSEYLEFVAQEMDADKSRVVDNPMPLPINESKKVFRYHKTTDFYSNLSYTAPDYKFDLTDQNKIRVKVYIPSFNDYTSENDVAGDWITNRRLLPQLAVKLQNSVLGGDTWQTQTEIVKAGLQTDKWLALEFDFSEAAERTDYDRIVIQFGGEGHTGSGYFYFDDFEFKE